MQWGRKFWKVYSFCTVSNVRKYFVYYEITFILHFRKILINYVKDLWNYYGKYGIIVKKYGNYLPFFKHVLYDKYTSSAA